MNIGLVVNARGKMCLVYDEEFEAVPLWVGYHVDKRQLEIIFDTGATYPIDWEATDEMDDFLRKISKILLIRMENQKPIEGFDTSFLKLQANHVIDSSLKFGNGLRGDDRFGQFAMEDGGVTHDRAPTRAVYDGVRRVLRLQWSDGEEYAVSFGGQVQHAALLAQPFLRFIKPRSPCGVTESVWLDIEISMAAMPQPGEPPEPVDLMLSWELPHFADAVLTQGRAAASSTGEAAEWDARVIWRSLEKIEAWHFWRALNASYLLEPVAWRHETIVCAPLPWYKDVLIVSRSQIAAASLQQCFVLWQHTTGRMVVLDLKAATLGCANNEFGLALNVQNACSYLRFAHYFQREQAGTRLYTETIEEIRWWDNANEEEKRVVELHLQPMSATQWDGNNHTFLVTATIVNSRNLYAVKIILAFEACTLELAGASEPVALQPGDSHVLEAIELLTELHIQERV